MPSHPNDPPLAIDVLDLPALYTKPPASTLLSALSLFVIPPPSWDRPSQPPLSPPGLTKWLTNIIASPLGWINDEDTRQAVQDQASERLSERCGRSAMPPLTRTFRIPLDSGRSNPGSGTSTPISDLEDNEVEIVLHEPSLTADNLGLKTWASSYLLSKRLHRLDLPLGPPSAPRALELGAGTGLVGLAAAAVYGIPVMLTDLPEIVLNLQRNVDANAGIAAGSGCLNVKVLDWREIPEPLPQEGDKFDLVLAADPLYSKEHPGLLVGMIRVWLKKSKFARVVVEMPLREGYQAERDDFKGKMLKSGLGILEEGIETGYDDWGTGGGKVECWWSVWGWS